MNTSSANSFTLSFVLRTLSRGLRKKCPSCGAVSMFKTYYTMHQTCPNCGVRFERENGEYVTSMYISIMITEVLFVIFYLFLNYALGTSVVVMLAILVPFNGLFPVWFYPRSKSLWAAALMLMGRLYPD
ncbi:MAG TPA: DUF983 domain-containing protein [Candidatus Kapabacteria bacterium]|nr:DUF983 domain-containing protein [Candidatus Kapabacteria bacterium]